MVQLERRLRRLGSAAASPGGALMRRAITNGGRGRTSSRTRHTYSPVSPATTSWAPAVTRMTTSSAEKPRGSTMSPRSLKHDHERRVREAETGQQQPEQRGGAHRQVREGGERVDEVLDLAPERPGRPSGSGVPLDRRESSRGETRPRAPARRGRSSSRASPRIVSTTTRSSSTRSKPSFGNCGNTSSRKSRLKAEGEQPAEERVVALAACREHHLRAGAPGVHQIGHQLGWILQICREGHDGIAIRLAETGQDRGVGPEVAGQAQHAHPRVLGRPGPRAPRTTRPRTRRRRRRTRSRGAPRRPQPRSAACEARADRRHSRTRGSRR